MLRDIFAQAIEAMRHNLRRSSITILGMSPSAPDLGLFGKPVAKLRAAPPSSRAMASRKLPIWSPPLRKSLSVPYLFS